MSFGYDTPRGTIINTLIENRDLCGTRVLNIGIRPAQVTIYIVYNIQLSIVRFAGRLGSIER